MSDGGMPSPEALGGIISTLMSNPDLLRNIKNMLGDFSSFDNIKESGEEGEKAEASEAKTGDESSLYGDVMGKLPQLMKAFSGNAASPRVKEREALLCALKPFLSSERAEKIDKLINIIRIGDILSGI